MIRHLIQSETVVLALAAFAAIWCSPALGEEAHHHNHNDHSMGEFELGVSAGYVELDDGDGALGMHLHATKRVILHGLRGGIAIGPAAEFIFGDHEHYTVMLSLSVHPWRGLALAVAPGIEWAAHEDDWESRYATHFEAGYLFDVGRFDLGPTIGYLASEEGHYSIGIHAGIHL